MRIGGAWRLISESEIFQCWHPDSLAALAILQDDNAQLVGAETGKRAVCHSSTFAFMASTRASSPGCLSIKSVISFKTCSSSA